ncbi:MAG: hypothetical protein IJ881_03640 [Neisseriaceae bacterium]|nr:hypothetical protein [Neisseriaceae bacterium]
MRIYLSYAQFQAIRKSVIISDLVLIVLTAITCYISFFTGGYDINGSVHLFIFAIACFFVKLLSNLFVEKQYRFPAFIHLFAPIPFSVFFWVIFPFLVISFDIRDTKLAVMLFISLLLIYIFLIWRYFYPLKPDYILPTIALFNYYKLIEHFIGETAALCFYILQIGCFLSIVLSFIWGQMVNLFGDNPIEQFAFVGLFTPLCWFILINLLEIIIFSFVKFHKEGKYIEIETEKMEKYNGYIKSIPLSILFAFFIVMSTYFTEPFVKNYLGSQYEPIMKKLIMQKYYHRSIF